MDVGIKGDELVVVGNVGNRIEQRTMQFENMAHR